MSVKKSSGEVIGKNSEIQGYTFSDESLIFFTITPRKKRESPPLDKDVSQVQ